VAVRVSNKWEEVVDDHHDAGDPSDAVEGRQTTAVGLGRKGLSLNRNGSHGELLERICD